MTFDDQPARQRGRLIDPTMAAVATVAMFEQAGFSVIDGVQAT